MQRIVIATYRDNWYFYRRVLHFWHYQWKPYENHAETGISIKISTYGNSFFHAVTVIQFRYKCVELLKMYPLMKIDDCRTCTSRVNGEQRLWPEGYSM